MCVCRFQVGSVWRSEKKVLAEEANQAFPRRPQEGTETRPPLPALPTPVSSPAARPGKGEAKVKPSLTAKLVFSGERETRQFPGEVAEPRVATGLGFYSDGKKTCSNRSDALFSNPKYPVAAAGSVTAGGSGARGVSLSFHCSNSFFHLGSR